MQLKRCAYIVGHTCACRTCIPAPEQSQFLLLPADQMGKNKIRQNKGSTKLGRTHHRQLCKRKKKKRKSFVRKKKSFLKHIPLSSYRVAFIYQLIANGRKATKRTVLLLDHRRPTLRTPQATSPTKN